MELLPVTGVCDEPEVRPPALLSLPWSLSSQAEAREEDFDVVSSRDLDNPFLGKVFMAEVSSNLTLCTS